MMPKSKFMIGNEAIAIAAVHAGVSVAAGYPGTPSTEIIENISRFSPDVYVEWSINEKIAFETAYGAAISGAYGLVAVKHVGLNVASDPLFSSSYTGINGALVIVSADDSSMWSSQNEQDNRYYGLHALIPVIEPYDVQSAYDFTLKAFEISRRFHHPVILRTTTRIGHVRSNVLYSDDREPVRGRMIKDPNTYVLAPENARNDRKNQLARWKEITDYVSSMSSLEKADGDLIIITGGISYSYVREVLDDARFNASVLRLDATVPVAEDPVLKAVKGKSKVLVVEENDPVIEMQVAEILAKHGILAEFHGKDLIPMEGEMTFEKLKTGLYEFLGVQYHAAEFQDEPLTPRPPALCPGCPHRSSFFDIKKGLSRISMQNTYFSGDIGCYTLGALPPFREQDSATNMGSSLGISNGVFRSTGQVPVAIIGDSTFFHSGMEGIANAVYNHTAEVIVVLDNRSTAMTGQQPSPSTAIDIAKVCSAMGIEYVETFDPFDADAGERSVQEAAEYVKNTGKPAVVIAKRACALEVLEKVSSDTLKAHVDQNKCTGCSICYDFFTCPSIVPLPNRKAMIDDSCIGCGACVEVCPFKAITVKGEKPVGWEEAWNA
ncbi:indolepyruvate ferredoxin oxidoreductase subunit alpha [Thermoplasma sp. Kam2015]|uniref:thiamine pyrophosphate-dependent enzyme n=1 Tax=Thermoplasma sp. Kam2015 TaxID=2094122 RepID=UPI000D8E9D68|nr:indolepyruvate ferredoxin oxidoreductase subunit alpha [Thermoplasma sp. Kam2015]PYB68070.1 indolepyruvate ferredoxin oxidoreductase subunit alpha [Thermoplasma sp. Kam2015]